MNPLRSFDRRRGNAQGVVSVSICGLVVEVRIKHRVKLADPQVCIEAAAPPRRAPSAATLAAGGTGHRQGATNAVQRASAPVVVAISAPRRRFRHLTKLNIRAARNGAAGGGRYADATVQAAAVILRAGTHQHLDRFAGPFVAASTGTENPRARIVLCRFRRRRGAGFGIRNGRGFISPVL